MLSRLNKNHLVLINILFNQYILEVLAGDNFVTSSNLIDQNNFMYIVTQGRYIRHIKPYHCLLTMNCNRDNYLSFKCRKILIFALRMDLIIREKLLFGSLPAFAIKYNELILWLSGYFGDLFMGFLCRGKIFLYFVDCETEDHYYLN